MRAPPADDSSRRLCKGTRARKLQRQLRHANFVVLSYEHRATHFSANHNAPLNEKRPDAEERTEMRDLEHTGARAPRRLVRLSHGTFGPAGQFRLGHSPPEPGIAGIVRADVKQRKIAPLDVAIFHQKISPRWKAPAHVRTVAGNAMRIRRRLVSAPYVNVGVGIFADCPLSVRPGKDCLPPSTRDRRGRP